MTMIFRYRKLPNKKGNDVRSPSIPVTLKGKAKASLNVIALLDSGADVSVIPKDLAKLLNLDLSENISESYGIEGSIKVRKSKMSVIIQQGHEKHKFNISVQVPENDDFPIILGRKGIFDKFEVAFDETDQKIRLKRKSKNKL